MGKRKRFAWMKKMPHIGRNRGKDNGKRWEMQAQWKMFTLGIFIFVPFFMFYFLGLYIVIVQFV
jgi:hypothetical protein